MEEVSKNIQNDKITVQHSSEHSVVATKEQQHIN